MDTVNQARKIYYDVRNSAFFNKYSDIFRYLSLTVCGFAIGSIYNAFSGYSYSERAVTNAARYFLSPFSAQGGKDAFSVISDIVSNGRYDRICLLLTALAGLSVVCDLILSMTLMSRGLTLALLTGIFAENGETFARITPHPALASAIILFFYTVNTVSLIVFSALTLRGTAPFRQTLRNERDVVFSRRFISMVFTVLCFYGLQIMVNLLRGVTLEFICKI